MNHDEQKRKLETFEKQTGLILPEALKQVILDPPELEDWAVAEAEHFTTLGVLDDPSMPFRSIPFMTNHSGEFVVYYFPRIPHPPRIMFRSAEGLFPMTTDELTFIGSPEQFLQYENFDLESGVCVYDQESSQVLDLLYKLDDSANAEELLKPLCLYNWDYAPQILMRLENAFANRWTGSELARLIGGRWQTLEDLLAGQWWQDLAKSLVESGYPAEALSAIENAQACYLINPTSGYPGALTDSYYTTWPALDALFKDFTPVIQEFGDGLDKYLLPTYLELAAEFASMRDGA